MEMNSSSDNKQYLPIPCQMGFAELLDTTFSLYRSHFLQFLAIASVYFSTIVLGGTISLLRYPLSRGSWISLWFPILFVNFGFCIVVVSGLFTATSQAFVYGKISVGAAFKRGQERFFPCFFGILIYSLLATIIYFAITLPIFIIFGSAGTFFLRAVPTFVLGLLPLLVSVNLSVYFLSHWSFMTAAVLIEGKSMREGMRRRRELARQKSFQIVGVTSAIILIYIAIGFILRCSLGLLLGLIGITDLEEWSHSFGMLFFPQFPIFRDALGLENVVLYLTHVSVDTITMPIWIIGLTLIYFNQRIQREGFDIEMMTHRQGI